MPDRLEVGSLDEERLISRGYEVTEIGKQVLQTERDKNGIRIVETGPFQGFRAAGLAFLFSLLGREHVLYVEFDRATIIREHEYIRSDQVRSGISVISALQAEIRGGWLRSLSSLVAADIFSDFLDMAGHLQEQGYKDAAAVISGTALEGHLRKLCTSRGIALADDKDGIPVPRKADRLNAELKAKGVYNALDHKQVTAWFGIRNAAAHGDYAAYTSAQVQGMIEGVLHFMTKIPQ